MAFIDVENRFSIVGDSLFQSNIKAALTIIYDNSPLAALAIDNWLSNNTSSNIVINYSFGIAEGVLNGGIVNIDPIYLSDHYYFSTIGYAVQDGLISGLAHELGHAVVGTDDTENWSDLRGENINLVNTWFDELNIPRQTSYQAYVFEDMIIPGFDYTRNEAIVNSIVDKGIYEFKDTDISFDSGNVNLQSNGLIGSTLIIGGQRNNNYVGTSSRDWIYGGDGQDTLSGGDGNDVIEGGNDADIMDGGVGNDTLSYRLSESGVHVIFGDVSASTGMSVDTGDIISNFEGVFGSSYDDVLDGELSTVALSLDGGAGSDSIRPPTHYAATKS